MPELPEVETVKETLKGLVLGSKIDHVSIIYPSIIEGDRDVFCNALNGKVITDIKRRGKYLIFEAEDTAFYSHLRMEGKYFVQDINEPLIKHTHVVFHLSDGRDLRYNDVRKFGRMALIDKDDDYKIFRGLGPEPFSPDFDHAYVKEHLAKIKRPIKTVLLEQDFVAGIGNIYADEILFRMKVDPRREALSITDEEIDLLIEATSEILRKAIEKGGTTIRSYTSSLGVTGRFQNELGIHTKEVCPICGNKVMKIKVGGRGTYLCPSCQK